MQKGVKNELNYNDNERNINNYFCAQSLQSCPAVCNPMDYILHQVSLSMGFSRQEYCSGLPFPPPRDLPNPGIEPSTPVSPVL